MPIIHTHRLKDLSEAVDPDHLAKVWNGTVRQALRKQRFPDLHDYLDVHRNLKVFIQNLREDVLSGAYQTRKPDVAATEKGKGLRRLLLIPAPADALLLQALSDRLEQKLIRQRPSNNAYYSRSHIRPDIEDLSSRITYPWWVKWKQFIETIWKFRRDFPYLVVTDITNYFDNIDTNILRSRMTGMAKLNEAEVDLLLHILDHLKTKSFYGSRSVLGLPQIDLDAPRLLATAYLYEADELLRRRTRNHFVRWMDDIDFGARSVEDAHDIIGELDHRLHGLNVRLNSGKTRVLTRQGAEEHFWITENIRLNQCKDRFALLQKKRHTLRWRHAVAAFEKKAKGFLQRMTSAKERVGHWEKVYLRYFSLAAFIQSTIMESTIRETLLGHPSMRDKVIGYLRSLGYSPSRMTTIKQLIKSQAGTDLCACLDAVEVATQWEVPDHGRHLRTVRSLLVMVERYLDRGHTPMFVCGLMLRAKYSSSQDLAQFIRDHLRRWRHSIWGLRQVAACIPLLKQADASWVMNRIIESSAPDAVRVIGSLNQIRQVKNLGSDKQIKGYAEWRDKSPYGYSLSRFIIVIRLLTGDLLALEKQRLFDHVLSQVTDPVFRARLVATALGQGLKNAVIAP